MLGSPPATVLVATRRHEEILEALVSELPELGGNRIHDVHTAALMREHGISRIVTYDQDFERFPFLEVTVPSD